MLESRPGPTPQSRRLAQRAAGSRSGWPGGLVALVAIGCCAVPPLVAAGAFAGLAGIGLGGVTGIALGVTALAAAAVLLVRGRSGRRCGGANSGSCGCADEQGDVAVSSQRQGSATARRISGHRETSEES